MEIFGFRPRIDRVICGVASATALFSLAELSVANQGLSVNSHVVEARSLESLKRALDLVSVDLQYIPSGEPTSFFPFGHGDRFERFPMPLDASRALEAMATRAELGQIDSQNLAQIAHTLPAENDSREFQGQKVNDDTFSAQRAEIADVIGNIDQKRQQDLLQVPTYLTLRRDLSLGGLITFLAVAIGAGVYGVAKKRFI